MIPQTNIQSIRVCRLTIDPASVNAQTSAEQTFTLKGVTTNDIVLNVIKPTATAGLGIANARISGKDTLAITFQNSATTAVNAGSEEYKIVIARPSQDAGVLPNGTVE
jgi:hypothetical protein